MQTFEDALQNYTGNPIVHFLQTIQRKNWRHWKHSDTCMAI